VSKTVELRRHTASDGDVLSREGIEAAVEIGTHLQTPTKCWFRRGLKEQHKRWHVSSSGAARARPRV
jgi:hypothetical protein